jgi:methane monooxygenase PmoA-like
VTLVMLDHPANPNSPTYWHARGYGLFAANPLGRKVFDEKQPEVQLTLEPGASVTFRHRLLIFNGPRPTNAIESAYRLFAESK